MDGFTHFAKVGTLFAEDFDLPEVAPEPEVIEPVFSAGELTAAREAAWRDGHDAGLQDAATSDAAATRQAIAAIAEQFAHGMRRGHGAGRAVGRSDRAAAAGQPGGDVSRRSARATATRRCAPSCAPCCRR